MFEGLVRQLLLGYLGRYIKDIQRDQLKITLWNEEVLLENVELILEAFDYLQLPFALKEGRVGRLSIKIPWKKLGWDPIIITLEDVYICACQRDDQEWSIDAIERRELAGKKAKLAAAELAKLSRRVCDKHAGQSFSSYITAKILEGIQVSIRNFHVLYCDMLDDSAHTVFGLKFSSLTITKQDPIGMRLKGGQVNKLVEIQGLQIYYRTFSGTLDLMNVEIAALSKFRDDARVVGDTHVYILAPLDVSLSLLVKRSGKLENDAPQYAISIELSGLIISLDEVQLQQILTLWDYLCTCRLWENYGRYRPWSYPLSRKPDGWQTMWWHYAQQSVLSDVRKRLKKTSWKYLGERLNYRRKYINLYKNKLECLQQEQLVSDDILRELEEMEKESDIDDILSYRSASELELQDFLVNSASNFGMIGANTVEKSYNDERFSSGSRGWLNWLSLGMLGAGGTDDSSQFSGVVSDEVIKDIYEATMFQPVPTANGDASANDEIYLSAIKFSVHQISVTLRNMNYGRAIAELIMKGISIECKLWVESAVVTASVNAVKMINPCNEQVNLLVGGDFFEKYDVGSGHPSLSIQVDVSWVKGEVQLSPKVILQLLEVTFDLELLLNIMEFYNLVESFKFQHERVLLSLSEIEDVKTRLLSKAEFILSSGKKVNWDVNLNKIIICIPWEDANAEAHKMIIECGALFFASKREVDCFSLDTEDQSNDLKNFMSSVSTSDSCTGIQLQDFYEQFEIKVNDFEMKIKRHQFPLTVSVLEKFCASITLASCVIPDESILKQLEVYILLSSLHAHFSPSLHRIVLGWIASLDILHSMSRSNTLILPDILQHNIMSRGPRTPKVFCFSVRTNMDSLSFRVDLENDKENCCILMLALEQLDIRYALSEFQDCWISVKAVRISMNSTRDNHILCSSGNQFAARQHDSLSSQIENSSDKSSSADGCFLVHYEALRKLDLVSHKCTVYVNDIELHCYPYIIGLLVGFFNKISRFGACAVDKSSSLSLDDNNPVQAPVFGFPRFGFSNFFETGFSECASIPLDCFPFVTIYNVGYLGCLESVLIHPIPEWRKIFSLRERKPLTPASSVKKGSKIFCAPSLKSRTGRDTLPVSQSFGDVDVLVNLILTGIKVYFHDSSCILATIMLPACSSSFSINEDCVDILCSTEGLLLSSSWWTENIYDSLWGPSVSNLPPILNIRVKKGCGGLYRSEFEISFSIQHVCCCLPPDFLTIIIGYFSLPDWTSTANECSVAENPRHVDSEMSSFITYKIEILDSILLTPVEGDGRQFLKLDVPHLYCSFLQNSDSNDVLKDISPECLVPTDKVADKNHCLNLFGRDLSLSLLLKDGAFDLLVSQNTGHGNIIIIQPLSADIWVRLPCESGSSVARTIPRTCVMARVSDFQLIAEDGYIFVAFEALLNIISQFSSVHEESKGFKSDLLNFLQIKCIKENIALPPETSIATFTEVSCCVNSLTINLCHSRKDSFLVEPVAKASMQLLFSGSFRNEIPQCMDISFSSLEFFSLHNSVMLAQCLSSCSISSVLDLHLSISDHGVNELNVFLPSLDIWLYLFDWIEVIELFNSCSRQWDKSSISNATSQIPNLCPLDQNGSANIDVSHKMNQAAVSLLVKSENIGVTVHIPVCVSEVAFSAFWELGVPEEGPLTVCCNKIEGECYGFIAVTLQSRCTELVFNGKTTSLESNMEKIDGRVGICKSQCVHSWPFFQLFQVNVISEISNNQTEPLHVKAEVRCDSLDVWLSHHVFYFWQHIWFKFPEAESSESTSCFFNFEIQLRKGSLLFTDARWGSSGPLLEILLRNLLLHANMIENKMESSVTGDLQVNYNNIHKVLWEPFIEPWKFQLTISRIHEKSALLNSAIVTDIHLMSSAELNLNVTESLIEAVFRSIEMIKDAWDLMGLNRAESQKFLNSHISGSVVPRRYAPYILQNLTSLPLVFRVYPGPVSGDYSYALPLGEEHFVQPGSSIPIYINEPLKEQLFCYRPTHSSDKISDKQFDGVAHHYVVIQLDGTSVPSDPISMDLVGVSYFEVDLTKPSNKMEVDNIKDASMIYNSAEENDIRSGGFVVPVVFDVSVQRYSKLVRVYSTVILINASSVPFEVRFDIPLGVSPKVLDPVYPGQELPLPLHLAEAGRMRWRPVGNTYLWSEAHDISNILSHANSIGFLRSFVCYPSHPSSDPFRCCISIQDVCLPSTGRSMKDSALHLNDIVKHSVEGSDLKPHNMDKSKKRFIHQLTLSSPLVVKNYLPEKVSLTIESGGVSRTAILSEEETSFFHIDSSHDLGIAFHMHGFKPSVLKFPRAETFSSMSKFSGTKFSLSETITFDPDLSNGPINVTVEKVMDAFSGAREICIFAPILLYNCTGFSLNVSNSANEMTGHCCIIPSCYNLGEQDLYLRGRKDGLGLLSSFQDLHISAPQKYGSGNSSSKNCVVSARQLLDPQSGKFFGNPLILGCSSNEHSNKHDLDVQKVSLRSLKNSSSSSIQSDLDCAAFEENSCKKVKGCIYSPIPNSFDSDMNIRISRCMSVGVTENMPKFSWSTPFALVPQTGSTSVLVPQSSTNAAYIISVTASLVTGPFSGRTRVITFQPRYIISNASSKDLWCKQKGTDFVFQLGIGQHYHLHWMDTRRELLVSIRFIEPGWQWSGSFLPEHLGDTQVKMRNYISGVINMIRVEVQNADASFQDENIVGSSRANSGTTLILLSDDDTGYMPYRIDNFSKERLRVYQQKCETSETIIHSYTSCPYAWDEPCYPHRLTVEVPGERIIGSYPLDDVKEYAPVYLPSTSEKPERTLLVSVHAEGAMKVLSIVDSGCHLSTDAKDVHVPWHRGKKMPSEKQETFVDYKEKISVAIPFIGISLMNSYPQEILFASAKNTVIDVLQSVDQQKFSFQVTSLQIDNQLLGTPYPIILSFDHEYRGHAVGQTRTKDDETNIKSESLMQISSDGLLEPVFCLAAAKWRNKDISLFSFEYINLRVSDFHLELEQEVILSLFDFFRTVSSRFQSGVSPCMGSTVHPLITDMSFVYESSSQAKSNVKANGDQFHSSNISVFIQNGKSSHLAPSVVPIGAPWQQIHLLARRQKKIYVEVLDIAPIKLTLSFSSSPWILRNGVLTSGESLIHKGLMALADIEGAQIYLKKLTITHHMASWESLQQILIRHYTRQVLHEMYKVFGSAGVIGNPMGFARSVGLGIKDFLSVPARSFLQSPAGLITGMAQGTTSLLSNTVYAISDAATQFSRAAHKGIVAFTFDEQAVAKMEKQQKEISSHSKGVIDEFFEGLTGLLQSPIKGAEKHGLPGVLSGVALGITGLVARPAASILEVTGKTAQSIRNRSKLHQMGPRHLRVRLPRPLSGVLPLRPYSWEEAVGTSVLSEANDGLRLKNEVLVMCKELKEGGKFVIITEKFLLIVSCSSLVDLGKPKFRGVPPDPVWVIEVEIGTDSIIHADTAEGVVHIVGSSSDKMVRQNHHQQQQLLKRSGGIRGKRWNYSPTPLPLFHTNLEFKSKEEAEEFLLVLLSTIEKGKERSWGSMYILHQINVK